LAAACSNEREPLGRAEDETVGIRRNADQRDLQEFGPGVVAPAIFIEQGRAHGLESHRDAAEESRGDEIVDFVGGGADAGRGKFDRGHEATIVNPRIQRTPDGEGLTLMVREHDGILSIVSQVPGIGRNAILIPIERAGARRDGEAAARSGVAVELVDGGADRGSIHERSPFMVDGVVC